MFGLKFDNEALTALLKFLEIMKNAEPVDLKCSMRWCWRLMFDWNKNPYVDNLNGFETLVLDFLNLLGL